MTKPQNSGSVQQAPPKFIELPTVPQEPETDFSRMITLLYGPPKIGKSTLASTYPKPLFISTEPGLRFLRVMQQPCRNWVEFSDIVRALRQESSKELYNTIVIDTVDLLYQWCENHVCDTKKIAHPSDEDWGKGWSYVRTEFQTGMRYLTSEGYGVVFISHHKEVEVSIRGVKKSKVVPSFTGVARKVIMPLVDFVLLLTSDIDIPERQVRRIYCRPSLEFEAGSRQRHFPETIDDVHYSAIADALLMAKAKEEEERTKS